MRENEASIRGRVVRDLIAHTTNDLLIGKKIKNGELRKQIGTAEPPWKCPECFTMQTIEMEHFTMELLESKENANRDKIILQLHGGGYVGAMRNAYRMFAGLYNEVSHGMSVLTPDYRVAPEHPYPAALEDAVCAYEWLLAQGWFSEQIIVAGDSAGGGLAMALMVPVLAGYIAYSIADRPGLAVGFTGGLLASSGNALVTSYDWADKTTGFQKFIADFAFQGANGGNTVSGFLGGILAGFLAGFIVLMLKKAFAKLPASLDGIKPTLIYPLLGILIISILMCFIFNPLIGLINTGLSNMLTSISDAGFITVLGLILGAMMAIDMGGPINKAAYVFGTGMLSTAAQMMADGASSSDPAVQACYIAMASIMVGGMVPPVGIALACRFFPKKFTAAERNSWVSNLIMGCSFITEGAIPFAAADPLHVIPCTLVGAGVAGFLSALFKCTLMAPHGGIFVFATVGNPLLYIVAWIIGSIITAVLLGLIKRDAE